MIAETLVDEVEGRKCYLDHPSDETRQDLTFILNLHGGGGVGAWQRLYFPAKDFVDDLGLVVATPSSKTKQPMTHWTGEADDAHLERIARAVRDRFGDRITSFWLVGHSQGGMTSSRLLAKHPYFMEHVDGWLSLSGGRIGGQAPFVEDFGPPRTDEERERMAAFRNERRSEMRAAPPHTAEFSFIFAVGEHEIVELPTTSSWAERFGAGPRERRPDVVDTEPGQVHDGRFEGRYTNSWGREPRGGTAEVYVHPGGSHVVADVVRLDKGHTEGLEPNITRTLLELMRS
jgi:pimeloyl-ACP methyl ester carboxylesterase